MLQEVLARRQAVRDRAGEAETLYALARGGAVARPRRRGPRSRRGRLAQVEELRSRLRQPGPAGLLPGDAPACVLARHRSPDGPARRRTRGGPRSRGLRHQRTSARAQPPRCLARRERRPRRERRAGRSAGAAAHPAPPPEQKGRSAMEAERRRRQRPWRRRSTPFSPRSTQWKRRSTSAIHTSPPSARRSRSVRRRSPAGSSPARCSSSTPWGRIAASCGRSRPAGSAPSSCLPRRRSRRLARRVYAEISTAESGSTRQGRRRRPSAGSCSAPSGATGAAPRRLRRLVVVPDGALAILPFAALPVPDPGTELASSRRSPASPGAPGGGLHPIGHHSRRAAATAGTSAHPPPNGRRSSPIRCSPRTIRAWRHRSATVTPLAAARSREQRQPRAGPPGTAPRSLERLPATQRGGGSHRSPGPRRRGVDSGSAWRPAARPCSPGGSAATASFTSRPMRWPTCGIPELSGLVLSQVDAAGPPPRGLPRPVRHLRARPRRRLGGPLRLPDRARQGSPWRGADGADARFPVRRRAASGGEPLAVQDRATARADDPLLSGDVARSPEPGGGPARRPRGRSAAITATAIPTPGPVSSSRATGIEKTLSSG